MGRWLRHHPGDVGLTARATTAGVYTDRWKWPLGAVLGHLCTLLRRGPGLWVAFGIAIVYTNGRIGPLRAVLRRLCTLLGLARKCERPWGRRSVHKSAEMAPRRRFGAFVYTVATRVAIRIATRAAPGGTSASTATACRRRPLSGPSRLVGKTDSERVAPLPGWRLRRGVNPHEPPKSPKIEGISSIARRSHAANRPRK